MRRRKRGRPRRPWRDEVDDSMKKGVLKMGTKGYVKKITNLLIPYNVYLLRKMEKNTRLMLIVEMPMQIFI